MDARISSMPTVDRMDYRSPWSRPVSTSLSDAETLYSPIVQTPDSKQWIDLDFVSQKLVRELRRQYDPSFKHEPDTALAKGAAKVKAWIRQSKLGIDIKLRQRLDVSNDEITDIRLVPDKPSKSMAKVPKLPQLAAGDEISEMADTSTNFTELDSTPRDLFGLSGHTAEREEPLPVYRPRHVSVDASSDQVAPSVSHRHGQTQSQSSIVATPTHGLSLTDSSVTRSEPTSPIGAGDSHALIPPVELHHFRALQKDLTQIKLQLQQEARIADRLQTLIATLRESNVTEMQSPSEAKLVDTALEGFLVSNTRRYEAASSPSTHDPISRRFSHQTSRNKVRVSPPRRAKSAVAIHGAFPHRPSSASSLTTASFVQNQRRGSTKQVEVSMTNPESLWASVLEHQSRILGLEHPLVYRAKSDFANSRANGHRGASLSALGVDELQRSTAGPAPESFVKWRRGLPRIETTFAPAPHKPSVSAPASALLSDDTGAKDADTRRTQEIHELSRAPNDKPFNDSPDDKPGSPQPQNDLNLPPPKIEEPIESRSPSIWNTPVSPHRPKGPVASLGGKVTLHILNSLSCGLDWLRTNYGPEPDLEPGKVRVRWSCSCGRPLFDDFVERRPGAARELEAYLNRPRSHTAGASPASSSSTQNSSNSYSGSSIGAPSSSTSWSSYPASDVNFPGHNQKPLATSNVAAIHPEYNLDPRPLWLLTCANEQRYTPKLSHLDMSPFRIRSDKDLAKSLRERYFSINNRWWRNLRLRGLTTIEFVQMEVHLNRFADIRKCPDMPPVGDKYVFDPGDLVPPVGSTYLLHLFRHPEDYDGELITYTRSPKKTEQLRLGVGWGINLVEGFLADRVWLVTSVLFGFGSLVFAVVWAYKKHSLQSAFGVASWMVSLAALMIGWLQACFG